MCTKISTSTSFAIILGLCLNACQSAPPAPERQPDAESPKALAPAEKRQSQELVPLSTESAPAFLRKQGQKYQAKRATIETDYGDIVIEFHDNCPLHRANFLYLAERNYFESTWFHRVSPGHVIQAGNSDQTETQRRRAALGNYRLEPEALSQNYHHRGAVAAARSYYQNPEKRSNPFEFYITLGLSYSPAELALLAQKSGFSLNDQQRAIYAQQPGAPHLDGEHTVFARVVKGMSVVDAIAAVETDAGEWPMVAVPIAVHF